MGSLSLLQGIFPTQGSNPGLPHCRQSLYHLSHKGSLRILEWVAYPFSSRPSWLRNQTGGLLHCRWILSQLSYQGSPSSIINIINMQTNKRKKKSISLALYFFQWLSIWFIEDIFNFFPPQLKNYIYKSRLWNCTNVHSCWFKLIKTPNKPKHNLE